MTIQMALMFASSAFYFHTHCQFETILDAAWVEKNLKTIQAYSQREAGLLDFGCEATQYQIIFCENQKSGYRSALICEDGPSPGIWLYFEKNQRWIGKIEMGT